MANKDKGKHEDVIERIEAYAKQKYGSVAKWREAKGIGASTWRGKQMAGSFYIEELREYAAEFGCTVGELFGERPGSNADLEAKYIRVLSDYYDKDRALQEALKEIERLKGKG